MKGRIYFGDYFILHTIAALPRPGGSRCPSGRHRHGNRACWQLPSTVIAVTSAVIAAGVVVSVAVTTVTVPRGRDPAPALTGTTPAVTAVAGRPSLSRWAGGQGLYRSPCCSRLLTKRSLARPKLRSLGAAQVAKTD